MVQAGVSRRLPALSVHRIGAQFLFDQDGLKPYWGLVSCYEPDHDETIAEFEAINQQWEITSSSHWSGMIADPQGRFEDGLNEYKYQIAAVDDIGDKDLTLTLRPGYPQATHVETGEEIGGIPSNIPESLRVQVESTNLEFDELLPVIRSWADAIDLNPRYFDTWHEWSRIYEFEAYLRLDRYAAENNITGEGGLLQQLAQFGSSDGYKGEYHWDHEDVQGHREAVALDPDTWEMLIPEQEFEKRCKCYHPKHARVDADDKDPLAHPKLEFQYWAGFDNESVPVSNVDQLQKDMQQALGNVLNWSGVSLQADSDDFVADPYYDPQQTIDEHTVYNNPMDELKSAIATSVEDKLIRPDLTESEFEVVQAVADGGSRHYHEIAELANVSSSTVYRALKKFDFIESENGVLKFADKVVRSKVTDVVERFEQSKDYIFDSIRDLAQETNPLSNSGDPSALERWMASHGAVLKNSNGEIHFEFPDREFTEDQIAKVLRSGYFAAKKSGLESKMRDAFVTYQTPLGEVRGNRKAFTSHWGNLRILGGYHLHSIA